MEQRDAVLSGEKLGRYLVAVFEGKAHAMTSFRPATCLPAALALILGVWGVQPSEWTLAAQSASPPAVTVDGGEITDNEIEQRARLLALSANVSEQAKADFQRLIKSPDLEAKMKELQREVVTSNPGKTREELIAIVQERQKQIGAELQKQAIEGARPAIMPKLRKDAKEELLDDRVKLQAAKGLRIDVSDDEVKTIIQDIASRNKMTYEQFAQHLKDRGVDIATLAQKWRAHRAWQQTVAVARRLKGTP